MNRLGLLRFLIVMFGMLMAAQVSAQATRTWVSGVGDDANPCSRTAPCKTFAGAISKTAAGGEINVLDPGGFGAVTITKAITIRADHVEAGVLASGTNGIVVQAGASDVVVLEGLDFQGLGTGIHGVNVLSGAGVYVIRCNIKGFAQNGINMASSTPGARVFIRDSTIIRNNGGVNVQGSSNVASITSSLIDGNSSFAIQANGAGNILGVISTILNASPTSVSLLNGAQAFSFGPSNVISGAGSFSATQPFN